MTVQCLLISIVMFKNTSRSKQCFYTIEIVQLYTVYCTPLYTIVFALYSIVCGESDRVTQGFPSEVSCG